MTWKPIETAPKDGTVIDLFYENYGRVTDCKWCNNKWSDKDDYGGHISSISLPHENPTHWMNIPEAPDDIFQSFMADVSYNVM